MVPAFFAFDRLSINLIINLFKLLAMIKPKSNKFEPGQRNECGQRTRRCPFQKRKTMCTRKILKHNMFKQLAMIMMKTDFTNRLKQQEVYYEKSKIETEDIKNSIIPERPGNYHPNNFKRSKEKP